MLREQLGRRAERGGGAAARPPLAAPQPGPRRSPFALAHRPSRWPDRRGSGPWGHRDPSPSPRGDHHHPLHPCQQSLVASHGRRLSPGAAFRLSLPLAGGTPPPALLSQRGHCAGCERRAPSAPTASSQWVFFRLCSRLELCCLAEGTPWTWALRQASPGAARAGFSPPPTMRSPTPPPSNARSTKGSNRTKTESKD